jgi:sulfoxide reductase catalytic subunit YedY
MSLKYSQITPRPIYLNRRRFLGAAAAAVGAGGLTGFGATLPQVNQRAPLHDLTGDKASPKNVVTGYNNFYEFGTDHEDPARNASRWQPPSNWMVSLEGEVARPKTLDLGAIQKLAPLEERIYRLRCVEHWSVVVPWVGFSLSTLLKQVEPTGNANYIEFESYYDPKQMISARAAGIPFPYREGLRLDEAMHPLTMLAMGMFGETLANQNGAPIRLVVPWKYGFKSIKSITRIRFVRDQPHTTWNTKWANAYGFYSNVNPNRDHPSWSQRREQRLGTGGLLGETEIDTQMYNGYGSQVASLYSGMDLLRYY